MDKIISEVAAERRRQTTELGWTPEHDDQHDNDQIIYAALDYMMPSRKLAPNSWAYNAKVVRRIPRRAELIKACALLVAEIERLDRREAHE
jgi:hypothetical protein